MKVKCTNQEGLVSYYKNFPNEPQANLRWKGFTHKGKVTNFTATNDEILRWLNDKIVVFSDEPDPEVSEFPKFYKHINNHCSILLRNYDNNNVVWIAPQGVESSTFLYSNLEKDSRIEEITGKKRVRLMEVYRSFVFAVNSIMKSESE